MNTIETFDFTIHFKQYHNKSIIETLKIINHNFAIQAIDSLPYIISSQTGEVVNNDIFIVGHQGLTISDLIEILPYIDRFDSIIHYNEIIWQNTGN